jgi:hypothetical protein
LADLACLPTCLPAWRFTHRYQTGMFFLFLLGCKLHRLHSQHADSSLLQSTPFAGHPPSLRQVVCAKLGFAGGAVYRLPFALLSSTLPIVLDELYCTGIAGSLADCELIDGANTACGFSQDLGVRCKGEQAALECSQLCTNVLSCGSGHEWLLFLCLWQLWACLGQGLLACCRPLGAYSMPFSLPCSPFASATAAPTPPPASKPQTAAPPTAPVASPATASSPAAAPAPATPSAAARTAAAATGATPTT